MALVAYNVNNGVEANGINYAKAYYKVTKDIDFQGCYWQAIGTKENPFDGYMNLGKHKFLNVSHYVNYEDPETSYGGLFWHISKNAKIIVVHENYWVVWVSVAGSVVVIGAAVALTVLIKKKRGSKYSEYGLE